MMLLELSYVSGFASIDIMAKSISIVTFYEDYFRIRFCDVWND